MTPNSNFPESRGDFVHSFSLRRKFQAEIWQLHLNFDPKLLSGSIPKLTEPVELHYGPYTILLHLDQTTKSSSDSEAHYL